MKEAENKATAVGQLVAESLQATHNGSWDDVVKDGPQDEKEIVRIPNLSLRSELGT